MKAYFLGESNRIASHDDLKGFGVFYKYIDADNYEEPIDAICKERNYKSRDFVKLNQETPDLDKKLDIFFEEHDHTDEEIRYILDGEGYFDVRDNEDRWIRLHVQRGDLIILPPFIYHRFTLTETKYVHAMRLFAENPRWEAYPRGPRSTIVDLCKNFYNLGWVSGTGGGISLRVKDLVFMAPSGVQKERIEEEDIYVMNMKQEPLKFPAKSGKKISACCPLFYAAFTKRNAGACIHSHSINTVLATLNNESEFVVTNLEMIKGIEGHGFYDRLVIPIIENTAHECELTQSLEEAMDKYPDVPAVLVRRHGLYVWGKDWVQAKTHAECLDYLFEIAVKMRQMGVDPSKGLTGPQTN